MPQKTLLTGLRAQTKKIVETSETCCSQQRKIYAWEVDRNIITDMFYEVAGNMRPCHAKLSLC